MYRDGYVSPWRHETRERAERTARLHQSFANPTLRPIAIIKVTTR